MENRGEVTLEQAQVNKIRSRLRTLIRHHQTSIAMHKRPMLATLSLAKAMFDEIDSMGSQYKELPEVQRWVHKFCEYVEQHELVSISEGKQKDDKSREEGQALQPDIGQDRTKSKAGG